jgi:hypothetical protein
MKLHLDSVELQPILNKKDFADAVKSQETRTQVTVATLDGTGVNMDVHLDDTTIMASTVTMNGLMIHCYKNKKYPFRRTKKFPLPMESFRSLSVAVEADTVKIHNGIITYEELPTEGFHNSWIKFEDVEAVINSVSNRNLQNGTGYSTVVASGRVMKTGAIKATFKVPLEEKRKYTAEGVITDLPLHELNPLLKDLAFVEITSGKLNKMKFEFAYDDESSEGQVHFDYEGLKILSLKKDPDLDINAFKTMLVNTAVKNDKTLDGDINVKRFKRKAVFHLWTMSLLDGIKSALLFGKNTKKKKKS